MPRARVQFDTRRNRDQVSSTTIVPVTDEDFAWMLAGEPSRFRGRVLPPGGVEPPAILAHIRTMVRRLHDAGCFAAWMVVADDEVVGLCSFKSPPNADGEVEIGYGIAESRRQRGHMRDAVAAILRDVRDDPWVRVIIAETAVDNIASQRVLEGNGFERSGTRTDEEDGELIVWSRAIERRDAS